MKTMAIKYFIHNKIVNLISVVAQVLCIAFAAGFLLSCSGDAFHQYEVNRGDHSVPYVPDTVAPSVVSAVATAKDTLVVTFSEEVDENTATESANYHVQGRNRVNVLADSAPVLDSDKKTVTLTLSTGLTYGMHHGEEYTLLVQRVKDLDGNAILNSFASFIGRGSVVAEVWRDEDKLPETSPYPAFSSSTIEFTVKLFGVVDGGYSYSIDNGAFSSEIDMSVPLTLSGLSEGFHTLKVVGKNGDTDEWQEINQATVVQFLVDTIPPTATLDRTPATVTTSRDIAIMVGGDDVRSYTYRINGDSESGPFAPGQAIVKEKLPDGYYTLYAWGIDGAGNKQANPTTYSWTIANNKPVAVLSNKPDRFTRLRSATILVGGTDVYYYRYQINGGSWSGYESIDAKIKLKNLPDGDYTIKVIGALRNGDPGSEGPEVSYTWTVDNVAPECTITNLPQEPYNFNLDPHPDATYTNSTKTNIIVENASGDTVGYRYRLIVNGSPGGLSGNFSLTTPIELNSLADGTYEIRVMAVDAAGNVQSEENATTYKWNIDTTAPKATLANLPHVNTYIPNINVGVGPSGIISYKYILEGATWSSEIPYTTNIARSNLTDGTYTLSVIARDEAGNWQSMQDPTRHVWTVDTVPPSVSLTNKPAPVTNVHTADFNAGGAGVVRYRFKVNGGNWSAEYDRYQYSRIPIEGYSGLTYPLPEGVYTIEVRGVDLAGNWQATPTTYSWTVTDTVPTAVLENTPSAMTNNDSINISVTGIEFYKYRLDSGLWSDEIDSSIPISKSNLSEGPHTLLVVGKQGLVWQGTDQATRCDWTIDKTAPLAELSNRPPSITSSTNASFKVGGVGVIAYKYSLDNPDPRGSSEVLLSTDDTVDITGLGHGPHTLYVIARDDAGNWQDYNSPTTHTWTVNTSVPSAQFVPGTLPANPTANTNISISVGGSGVVAYKYKLDSGSYSGELTSATPITRVGLSSGSHTVWAIAKNSVGTWQAEFDATHYTWVIDTTPPDPSDIILGNLPNDPTAETSINVTVSGTGITHYQYKINNEDWSADIPITDPILKSGLIDNEYTLYVVARDEVGNWLPRGQAKSHSWTVDTVKPVAALTNRPDDPTSQKYASFNVSGTGIIEYKYSFNGSAWSGWLDQKDPINFSDLPDAVHTIRVCGRKAAGEPFEQKEADATVYSWEVDTQPPTAVLGNLPSNPTLDTSISVSVGGTGVVSYEYTLWKEDNGVWVAESQAANIVKDFPIVVGSMAPGQRKLEVKGKDLAGNVQTTPTSYNWTINPPELISPRTYDAGDTTTSALITFSWVRPYGTADVKIQIASDEGFTNIVHGGSNGAVVGNVDLYEFTVTDTENQTYFARVSVNNESGKSANDPSWKDWGDKSNGITVTGGVLGTVYNAISLSAISGATVELRRMEDSFLVDDTVTDENGDFAFANIPIGSNHYKLTASASGYNNSGRNNITVVLGENTNTGITYLVPTGASSGTIKGKVIDANDASKLSGVSVQIYDYQNILKDTKTTDSNGDFTTKTLDAGVYTVRFNKTNYYELAVDNVVVNGNADMGRQAICAYLVEPMVRAIVLWGQYPNDLDFHVVGPSAKKVTETYGSGPEDRFHVGYVSPWQYNFNEATGGYEWSNPDRAGTRSTTALVQDVYSGNPLTGTGYGPEAINLWRYGGVQYARGIYTYTVRNYSQTNWYQSPQNITLRIYDSMGMRREVIMPRGANSPGSTTRDWKAVKINIQGNSRAKRTIIVPSQDVFFNAGNNNNKAGFDW